MDEKDIYAFGNDNEIKKYFELISSASVEAPASLSGSIMSRIKTERIRRLTKIFITTASACCIIICTAVLYNRGFLTNKKNASYMDNIDEEAYYFSENPNDVADDKLNEENDNNVNGIFQKDVSENKSMEITLPESWDEFYSQYSAGNFDGYDTDELILYLKNNIKIFEQNGDTEKLEQAEKILEELSSDTTG